MNDLQVAYIGGYSRSGSTILDILLSQHPQAFGTGELCYLFDDWADKNRTCSCGQAYSDCEFWADLSAELDLAAARTVIKAVEGRSSFNKVANSTLPADLTSQYTAYQETLFRYIQAKSGSNIIIDSSKTTRNSAGRCLALAKYTDLATYMIHLARNGRSTTKSFLQKGRNWALEGHVQNSFLQGLRSIVGWRLANDIAAESRAHLAEKYYLLKYENLIANPCSNLRALGAFLNIDVDDLVNKVESEAILAAGHQVGGNRLRRQKDLRFSAGVTDIPQLDIFHSLSFDFIAGDTCKKLGYL